MLEVGEFVDEDRLRGGRKKNGCGQVKFIFYKCNSWCYQGLNFEFCGESMFF